MEYKGILWITLNKLDNLVEKDKFLGRDKLPQVTGETENLNRPISRKEVDK